MQSDEVAQILYADPTLFVEQSHQHAKNCRKVPRGRRFPNHSDPEPDATTCFDECTLSPMSTFLFAPQTGRWLKPDDPYRPRQVQGVNQAVVQVAITRALFLSDVPFTSGDLRLALDWYRAEADCSAIWGTLTIVPNEPKTSAQAARS